MLAVTENAQAVIHDLTSSPQLPAGCGLRVSPSEAKDGLDLALAAGPQPGDEVLGTEEARVFVAPEAAPVLADQVLDATVADGDTSFFLAEQ